MRHLVVPALVFASCATPTSRPVSMPSFEPGDPIAAPDGPGVAVATDATGWRTATQSPDRRKRGRRQRATPPTRPVRNLMDLITFEEAVEGVTQPVTSTRHRAGIDGRSSVIARFDGKALAKYVAESTAATPATANEEVLATAVAELAEALSFKENRISSSKKSDVIALLFEVHAAENKAVADDAKSRRDAVDDLTIGLSEQENKKQFFADAIEYLENVAERQTKRLVEDLKARSANPLKLSVWAELRKFGKEKRERLPVQGYDTLNPLSKEPSPALPTELSNAQLQAYQKTVQSIKKAKQGSNPGDPKDGGDEEKPADDKGQDEEELKTNEGTESPKSPFTLPTNLQSQSLSTARDAVVDLSTAGAEDLDTLYVTFALVREGDGTPNNKTVVVERREKVFRVVRRGFYATLPLTTAFTKRTHTRNNFKTSPALSWNVHYRTEDYPYASGVAGVWDYISPGLGVHVTTTNYDNEDSGVGMGISLSLFNDWVQVGYGAAFNVNRDREYYWVGIGLYDVFQGISAQD